MLIEIYCDNFAINFYYYNLRHKNFLKTQTLVLCKYLFFTKHLTTHKASWRDLSASSNTSLFDPRTSMLTVWPGFVIPVTFTTLLVPSGTSSTSSAVAIISGVKWSKLAIGLQPKLYTRRDKTFNQAEIVFLEVYVHYSNTVTVV